MASEVPGCGIQLQFTPHLVPMVRGLLSTCMPDCAIRDSLPKTAPPFEKFTAITLRHGVPVNYPATKWANTPTRPFTVQVDNRTGRLVVMSAVDNLMKDRPHRPFNVST